MFSFRLRNSFAVIPMLAMLVACGSDPSGPGPTPPPPPPPPTPSFTLAVAGGAVAVLQGETATIGLTITRSGGFTGAVTVSVEGLPTGATATPLTIAANATTGQVSVVTTNAATIGTANLTLRGTGSGVEPRTVTVGLTVSAPPAAGTYTMTAASTALNVTAGTGGQVALTLARTGGFAGAVALTATTPAGVTVTFDPASVTGTTSTATISVAAGTAASVVQVTLRGNATGQPERTVTITLTIAAGGGGGGGGGAGNVAWIFCESAGIPIWLAAQDGNGAWTRVTPTGQEYRFQINSARGGVAYVTPEDAGTVLKVFYGTTAELQAQGGSICGGRTGPARTLTGTVANVPNPGALLLSLGGVQGTATPPGNNFSFARIPSGTIDVLGGASALSFGGGGVSFDLQRLFLRRSINPANNASLGTLDFTGAESFAPAAATATITNAGGEFIAVTGSFISTNGLFLTYSVGTGAAAAAVPIKGLPGDKRQAGELHIFNISATPTLDPNAGSTRNVGLVFAAMANQTITYGPTLTMPTVSSLGGGRLQAVYPVQSAYNRYWIASFDQTTIDRRADIEMTSGWLGGGASVTLAMPDLSGVTGWNTNWALAPGTNASWTVSGTGWDGGNGITSPPFVEGARYISATQRATITP
jgi:hypothetical protein